MLLLSLVAAAFSSYQGRCAGLACLYLQVSIDIKVCSCVPLCVYLLWIWVDSEQLNVTSSLWLSGRVLWSSAECFLWRPFVCQDNPWCHYHAEVIKITETMAKADCRWQKNPKTHCIWYDLSASLWLSTHSAFRSLDCFFDPHVLPCQSCWRQQHVRHQLRISLTRPSICRLAPKTLLSIAGTAPYPCESS